MQEIKLTCDMCEKTIGVLPNEEEAFCFANGVIYHSNYPSYVKLKIDGHGLLAKEELDVHLCKDCYNDIKHIFLHTNKEVNNEN